MAQELLGSGFLSVLSHFLSYYFPASGLREMCFPAKFVSRIVYICSIAGLQWRPPPQLYITGLGRWSFPLFCLFFWTLYRSLRESVIRSCVPEAAAQPWLSLIPPVFPPPAVMEWEASFQPPLKRVCRPHPPPSPTPRLSSASSPRPRRPDEWRYANVFTWNVHGLSLDKRPTIAQELVESP